MWDVIEHLPNMATVEPWFKLTQHIAITIPIMPEGVDLTEWKHFKPGEHLHYFTKEVLHASFNVYGFLPIKEGSPECPPREDVLSVIYKRR